VESDEITPSIFLEDHPAGTVEHGHHFNFVQQEVPWLDKEAEVLLEVLSERGIFQ